MKPSVYKAEIQHIGMQPGFSKAKVQVNLQLRGAHLDDPVILARFIKAGIEGLRNAKAPEGED